MKGWPPCPPCACGPNECMRTPVDPAPRPTISIAAARQIIESSQQPDFVIFHAGRGLFYAGGLVWARRIREALRWESEQPAMDMRAFVADKGLARFDDMMILPVLP